MDTAACTDCKEWFPITMITDSRCPECDSDWGLHAQRRGVWFIRRSSSKTKKYSVWQQCDCTHGPHWDPLAGPILRDLTLVDITDLREILQTVEQRAEGD